MCEQWTAATATDVFLQLACGMTHLHACGVLHRDLKTDNALIAGRDPLVVKWADFGCSVKLDDADSPYGPSTLIALGNLRLQNDLRVRMSASVCV